MVTGANQGLGFQTSLELARRGATLYMVCRWVHLHAPVRLPRMFARPDLTSPAQGPLAQPRGVACLQVA